MTSHVKNNMEKKAFSEEITFTGLCLGFRVKLAGCCGLSNCTQIIGADFMWSN